jgi:large subunit ribosomal protein L19
MTLIMPDEQPTINEEAPAIAAEPTAAVAEKPKTVLEEIVAATEAKPGAKKGRGKIEYRPIDKTDIKSGMLIRVHQKIIDINAKGEEKERVQVFAGMVLARKHGREAGATVTVRKISEGVGVEKIYPLNLPSLTKFELVRRFRVRQARPYFLRHYKKKLKEVK